MTTTLDLLEEARERLLQCREWLQGHRAVPVNETIARLDAHIARESALQALTDDAQAMGLYEPKVGVSAPYYPAMPQDFADYIATQMPPDTIISDPRWWAPRIWRTAMRMSAAPQPVPPDISFPERDSTLPVEQQGVFRKFDVRRVDGSDRPGGKHFGCEYFVLDMAHDQYAKDAIRAYAEACRATYPALSSDLLTRYVVSQPVPLTDDNIKDVLIGTREELAAEVARLRAMLSTAPAVPTGWKLVPVEPTEEMIDTADHVLMGQHGMSRSIGPFSVYRAMLAAAPTPPKGE